jgi:hypothetical protein
MNNISIKSVFYLLAIFAVAMLAVIIYDKKMTVKTVSLTDGEGKTFTGTINEHKRKKESKPKLSVVSKTADAKAS